MFYKDERIAVFIDGANFFSAAKALNFEIDYRLLREEFMRRGKLIRMCYHIALLENDEFTTLRPLVDWLCYNGYSVASKTAREYTDAQGRRKVKSNVAIDIAVAALELSPHVDHIILFSGDGDLRPLVEAIKRAGVRVSIVSTIRSQPSMISDELRRTADNFIELDQLKTVISRPARQQTTSLQDEQNVGTKATEVAI
ncbi:NYN domain-containing protein [Thalassobacter stenotrophicus]|uniref:LabA-like NYN domain-containing protein n=1 Tax=Thalassobacter stenotrophicus TaxID=266809 RepID=UPI0022A93419|nr:NYN domain-containing protein [Thalassobacter stenotrophicus]UYP67382.1 NYN domain-containing protein [Thalassobacter stenotrophicus]